MKNSLNINFTYDKYIKYDISLQKQNYYNPLKTKENNILHGPFMTAMN